MNENPYEPPKSQVADVRPLASAPALWNPNAAANWSLLFTPVFGALLQMKNWQALNEPARASASRVWMILCVVVIGGLSVAAAVKPQWRGMVGVARVVNFALLLAWYFSSGRPQARYVKERFGARYERRGWVRPLLLAVLALVGVFLVLTAIAALALFLSS